MKKNFLEEEKTPTFEEIKENFNDFTKEPLTLSNDELNDENFSLYKRAKYILNSYLWKDLSRMKRTAPETCYTKDEPVEVFLNFIREYIARAIVKLSEAGIADKIIEEFNKTRNLDLSDDDYAFRAVEMLMDVTNMQEVINVTKKIPDMLDFSNTKGKNCPKIDFYRKWNANIDVVLTDDDEKYIGQAEKYNADLIQDPDEIVIYNEKIDRFMEKLPEQDKKLLFMRLGGKSYEDIAPELGYQDHTGVIKRMRRIGELFEEDTGTQLGFAEKTAKSSYNKKYN